MPDLKTLYHASMYDPAPVPSYWEATAPADDPAWVPLDGDAACDVAIIGGGYTGLSAALHLARDHGIDVRVLKPPLRPDAPQPMRSPPSSTRTSIPWSRARCSAADSPV